MTSAGPWKHCSLPEDRCHCGSLPASAGRYARWGRAGRSGSSPGGSQSRPPKGSGIAALSPAPLSKAPKEPTRSPSSLPNCGPTYQPPPLPRSLSDSNRSPSPPPCSWPATPSSTTVAHCWPTSRTSACAPAPTAAGLPATGPAWPIACATPTRGGWPSCATWSDISAGCA